MKKTPLFRLAVHNEREQRQSQLIRDKLYRFGFTEEGREFGRDRTQALSPSIVNQWNEPSIRFSPGLTPDSPPFRNDACRPPLIYR